MQTPISVVIITKNAEAVLHGCLDSVKDFPEVLIYDNGSTDNTPELARQFNNVHLVSGPFLGFGPTKHHAVSLAKHDWILSLDADERVTPELQATLENWPVEAINKAGKIHRENLLLGKPVKHSGWGNDWLVRFFHRHTAQFNDAPVHEQVITSREVKVEKIPGKIRHLAVQDLSQFLEKVNHYSSIRAENSKKYYSLPTIILKTGFAFLRTYLLRRGFMDGWRGLVISFSNANGTFWKHMKAYCKHKVQGK